MILIASLQETASWFPELLDLSQENPIPLYVEGQPLLTQDIALSNGGTDSSLPALKSSRVETLRVILVAKGHSREATQMMSRALRESSLHVYESHWARFVSFCRSKRWHVFRVRSHHFSTYMMHLFRDGLLPSTIISHRTSVASVLRHWVYDRAADPHIKLLIRAFRLERMVQCRIMPKWDLHSCTDGIDESAVRFGGRWSSRNLRWCHSTKMADHENSHSADRSIKFSGRQTTQTQTGEVSCMLQWSLSGHQHVCISNSQEAVT